MKKTPARKSVTGKGHPTEAGRLRMAKADAEVAEMRRMLRVTVDIMIDEADWDGIIDLLTLWVEHNDTDHWAKAQLGGIYVQCGDFDTALKILTDALSVCYECPAAQWYFSVILSARGQVQDAIDIWEGIVQRGAAKMRRVECDCCEGMAWAECRIAECKYALSKSYEALGYGGLSRYYMALYREDEARGRGGIFEGEG